MPSASAPSNHPATITAKCGAKTRRGTPCQKVAGQGTDHPGFGHCRNHGGCSPNGAIFAAKIQAAALALEYQVEPHDALLRAVGQAAKWELTCRLKVAELDESDLAAVVTKVRQQGAETTLERSNRADLNVWVKAHIQAVRDLASIAKTAIDAGVEERRVRVVEQLGGELGDLFAAVFAELQLTAEQSKLAPAVVGRHLRALEAGPVAA